MWVCNCKSKNYDFHPTQVYDDGLCYYCGHYALQEEERFKRRSSKPVKESELSREELKAIRKQQFINKRVKILQLKEQGLTNLDIAVMFQINVDTVNMIRNMSGTYKKYRDIPEEEYYVKTGN